MSILDPVVQDADCSVQYTLERKFGAAEAEKYAAAYINGYAAPVLIYRSVQSAWDQVRAV